MRHQKHPFPFDTEAFHVMQSFAIDAKALLKLRQESLIDPNNIQYFQHGTTWQSHHSFDPDQISEMRSYEDSINISLEDIILGKTQIIQNKLEELTNNMSNSFSKSFFTTISDTCGTHGNVVETANGLAETLIEMLEKLEFGVNREGQVSLPQILGGLGLIERISQDEEINTKEYQARIETIIQKKSLEALERERLRKAKFLKKD